MHFLSSRAERVAAHIRDRILRKEWSEPFPSSRDWARQLGVSRATLSGALAALRKEGLLRIEPRRGIRLGRSVRQRKPARRLKAARFAYYGVDFPESPLPFLPWIGPLSLELQRHRIQLNVEKCSAERLRRLCSARDPDRASAEELLLPESMPAQFQKLLVASRRPAVLLGAAAPGIPLPFVNIDNVGAVRHATHYLLRRGFRRIALFLDKEHSPGNAEVCRAFSAAGAEWPHQPVQTEIALVSLRPEEERNACLRFASRFSPGQGILILPPLSVGLLVTTLLARGVAIPEAAEIVVVMSHPDAMRVHPPLAHYPFPIDAFVKTVAAAAAHFFDTGRLPALCKVLTTELVPAAPAQVTADG